MSCRLEEDEERKRKRREEDEEEGRKRKRREGRKSVFHAPSILSVEQMLGLCHPLGHCAVSPMRRYGCGPSPT